MTGRIRILAAGAAAVTLVAVAPASSAFGSTTGGAYSAAAKVTTTGGLSPQVTTSGLLAFLNPLLTGVVNPLTNAVGALPSQLLASVAGGLTGAGLEASSPSAQQTAPGSGYPTCTSGGWNSSDCYGPVVPTIGLPPLLSISSGTIQGFATGDATGYTAKAHLADPNISLLGITVGDLGLIEASAFCAPSGTCTTTQSLAGASLLNGLVTANVASATGLLSVGVAGTPLVSGTNVTVPAGSVPAGLLSIKASLNSNLATVKIGLSLTGLLNGLGLGGLLSGTSGLIDNGSTATATLTLGPGSSVSSGSAQSWGLELGVDVQASISLSVLGLAGVTITIPTGIAGAGYGNLLDLKLAYTNAYTGSLGGGGGGVPSAGPQWIPPGLI
jgi:hypothetical protein